MTNSFELDVIVENNFRKVKLWLLIPPLLLLILFYLFYLFFWFSDGTNFVDEYVESQKSLFFLLNNKLSRYPDLLYNITQLGDALVLFPLIIIFLFCAPKFWEVLLTSSIITLVVSAYLKVYLIVPRPACVLDNYSFMIMGKTLTGNTSLPSGHSMTSFMTISLLLFAFMPEKKSYKIVWSLLMLTIGSIIAFSRVGVGAHYPFDVIVGSGIGFIAAIIGITLNNKWRWLDWIKNKRFHPIFMFLLLIWTFLIVREIMEQNLPIFYLSLISLIGTLFLITKAYVKKN